MLIVVSGYACVTVMNWKQIRHLSTQNRLYEVSDEGRVRVSYELPLMKARGYCYAAVRVNGLRRNFSIHRLVAETFIPNPEGKPCVNHIDNNPANNRVENLEWVTFKENTQHACRQGRLPSGERHAHCKLSDAQVREIHAELLRGETPILALAKRYGVSTTQIGTIRFTHGGRNRKVRGIPLPLYKPKKRLPPPKKLAQEVYDAIHAGLLAGESKSALARRLKVSKQCVFRYIKRKGLGGVQPIATPHPLVHIRADC